jgi:hypothetical protein
MSSDFAKIYNNIIDYPTIQSVADELGLAYKTVKNTASIMRKKFAEGKSTTNLIMRNIGKRQGDIEIEQIETPEEPIEDLIERAIIHNERKAEYASRRKVVDINLHVEGPFGIVGLPDQHLNNPGTQLRKAMRDAEIIANTDGLYCMAVGDWLDNFIIGRLERERRGDVMSHSDAMRLQEYYVTKIAPKLLAAIGGNHNDWPQMLGGSDPLGELFHRLGKQGIYDADEMRVRLNLPSGHSFVHLVRHIFPGHSKYNTAHGVLAWMLEKWQGEDCLWGGHIHSSAHVAIEREYMGDSKVVHGMQLATYKTEDKYAISRGFRKNTPFIAPIVIHVPETGKTIFFEDISEGVAYLDFLRKGLYRKPLSGILR